jgi:RNA 3'-phosphate cyclase
MIEIDGSFGEAGGQILRTALSLSAITKKPCRIFNIRVSRPKPGLATQHLAGIQALSQLCDGKLESDFLGSEEISFFPGPIGVPSAPYGVKEIKVKIETAGSIALVLQTLISPALFASSPINPVRNFTDHNIAKSLESKISNGVKIFFDGGATDTFFSPTIDYFRHVFLKILEKIGAKVEINIIKRGYYPEGGAKVEVKILPLQNFVSQNLGGQASKLKNLSLVERGQFKKILIISGASDLLKEKKVAERQIAGAREVLGKLKLPTEERTEYYQTQNPGSQICLIAEFENTVIGTDNLGKLGKRAEDVGKEAALELLKEQKSNACLDKHLADQILPFMALLSKKSQLTVTEITEHCKTNIWVIEKFLDGRFEIKENTISWIPN